MILSKNRTNINDIDNKIKRDIHLFRGKIEENQQQQN